MTLKDQKDVKRAQREVRGAAVPYHEPTSTDDDDDYDVVDDADDDVHHDVMSTSPRSWPSTPSTPSSLASTAAAAPLELSARALLSSVTGNSASSPAGSPSSPVVYLPQSRGGLQLVNADQQQSLAALAETGNVDALKAALKLDKSSVNDTDEVFVH